MSCLGRRALVIHTASSKGNFLPLVIKFNLQRALGFGAWFVGDDPLGGVRERLTDARLASSLDFIYKVNPFSHICLISIKCQLLTIIIGKNWGRGVGEDLELKLSVPCSGTIL